MIWPKLLYDCENRQNVWCRTCYGHGFVFKLWVFHRSSASKERGAVAYLHKTTQKWLSMEVQADFALNPEMLKERFPLAGKKIL
jgi:hypothetical protein